MNFLHKLITFTIIAGTLSELGNCIDMQSIIARLDMLTESSEQSESTTPISPVSEASLELKSVEFIESMSDEITATEPPNVLGLQNKKFNCFPFKNDEDDYTISEEDLCRKIGCEWYPRGSGKNWRSYCYTPRDYGYKIVQEPIIIPAMENAGKKFIFNLVKTGNKTYFGKDERFVNLLIGFEADYRIHFKITSTNLSRWEVPMKINPPQFPKAHESSMMYNLMYTNEPVFSFKIVRNSTGKVIFDTSVGGLTFSDQFLQISTTLPSKNIYGFGEQEQPSFKHSFDSGDFSNVRRIAWPMFSRDIELDSDEKVPFKHLDGVHPYYTVLEDGGNAHSVLFLNSNAQEVELLPIPGLIYRTIGGVLDFYIFMGPKPENTVQQYTEAIGRPFVPPYYSLGIHVSPPDYENLTDLQAAVELLKSRGDMFDTIHLGKMVSEELQSFSVDESNFPEVLTFLQEQKANGTHFVIDADPLIRSESKKYYYPLELGKELDIWIKDEGKNPVKGHYEQLGLNVTHYYPDFLKPSSEFWWKSVLGRYLKSIEFAGVNLFKNQPYNFVPEDSDYHCSENKLNNPPYPLNNGDSGSKINLNKGTICADSQHATGSHYDLHSLYGWKQSELTAKAMAEVVGPKRFYITSASTFPGSGRWAGHFFENSQESWRVLHSSIIKMLQFNQFGIPFVGSDICSFPTSEELCLRWAQLGAFYPLWRSNNDYINTESETGMFSSSTYESIKSAVLLRYSLIPHLNTLFFIAHTEGNTVVRSLWHEFPRDPRTHDIDRQFLWGRGLMVAPILEPGVTSVDAYLPNDRWYDFRTLEELEMNNRGQYVQLNETQNSIPVLIRGYTIIPIQRAETNTKASRDNPFDLIVALCIMRRGEGDLFFDDGESADFLKSGKYFHVHYEVYNKTLTASVLKDGYPEMAKNHLASIKLLGADNVKNMTMNGELFDRWVKIPNSAGILLPDLNIPMNSPFTLTWTNFEPEN